jgi:uncharacterized protein YdhG (YjbR/CyaY superfamily)
MTASKTTKPEDVDQYLAVLPEERRAALEKLRTLIKTVAPKAAETISWGMPFYKYSGKQLVAFAAWKNHIGLYVLSSSFLDAYKDELKDYEISAGTIRLPFGQPLPVALIEKLVKARVAEIEAMSRKT